MSEWCEVMLGSVADLINGDRGKNYPSAKHRAESGIPFVNAGHLVDGRVRPGGDGFISQERYALLRSGLVEVGDVLLCIRGSLGRVAIATPDVVPSAIASSLVIVRPRQDLVPRFLLASLQAPRGVEQIAASNNGVAQPNIGAAEVGRFRIVLPPVATQRRIAVLLEALDDLIENNRRRVHVLEQMAQTIYREWFVRFRYAGHEGVPLVDSPLGPIPDGWTWLPFSNVASFVNGFAFKPAHRGSSGRPIIKIKELKQGVTDSTPRCDEELVDKKYWIEPGDLLFSWSADLGIYRWSGEPGLLNQHLFVVAPHDHLSIAFLQQSLDASMSQFWDRAQGTTMRHIKRSALTEVLTVVPPAEVVAAFTDTAEPLAQETLTLQQSTRNLADLRDLLLPQLVTGRIGVSHLDLDELTEAAIA